MADFLVIGAGIAGASIAAELAAHARVVVAEREESAGYHTTGRSAALYVASYGNPAIRALTAASRAFYDAPPDGFTGYPLLSPRGCLHIGGRVDAAALDALAAEIGATGAPVRRLSGTEACGMVPALRPEVVDVAVYEPDAADIDVGALHAGYLRMLRVRGGEVRLNADVVAADRTAGGWRVRLANGDAVEVGAIVDAAGAWGDEAARLAGAAPVGLEPKRRTAMILDPPPGAEVTGWPAVIDVLERFYFKPEAGKLLASLADETPSAPVDAAPDEMDIALCIDRIQGAADIPVRRVVRAWAGLRTFAPDRTPVIGYAGDPPGFFWFVGQGGYGMQIAPAAARLGAALALGRPLPDDITDCGAPVGLFDPDRFA